MLAVLKLRVQFRPVASLITRVHTGKCVLPLKRSNLCNPNYTTIMLITNSIMICVILCQCIGTISGELLRWKIEMLMTSDNRLYNRKSFTA